VSTLNSSIVSYRISDVLFTALTAPSVMLVAECWLVGSNDFCYTFA